MSSKTGPHIVAATKLPGLKIGVAVDGSRLTEKAFTVALALLDKRRGDRLLLLNVTDPDSKASGQHGHEHIQRQYQGLCIDARIDFDWNHRQRNIVKEDTLIAGINTLAAELSCDVIVAGCQDVGEDGCITVLGELCDSSSWRTDTVLVKSTSFEATQPLKYLLATDSSAPSRLAFQRALSLIKPEDSLVLLNVSSRNEVAPLFWNYYEGEMKRAGITSGSTMYVQSPSVSQAIKETVRDLQADVLIVGAVPKGSGLGLGSVSRDLLRDCRCSFLLVQARESATTTRSSLDKPGSHFSGQAREWGRTDSSSVIQGLPSHHQSPGGPGAPYRSASRENSAMAASPSPGRLSRGSGGSTSSVEEKMSLLEMFEEQKRQHLKQRSSGHGGFSSGAGSGGTGAGGGAGAGAHKSASGGLGGLAHIQSGVILKDGGEH